MTDGMNLGDGGSRDNDEARQAGSSRGAGCREYRTRATLLGLPLIHVALGGPSVEGRYRRGVARGWIAVGDFSQGVLLSVGGHRGGGGSPSGA